MPDDQLLVLILGGTTTVARALVHYLLGGSNPRVGFVRLADRFSVSPPSTYLDKPFLSILNDPSSRLEYKQVNLSVVDKHQDVFTPPKTWKGEPLQAASGGEGDHDHDGRGFDMVFDLTGETAAEKPELIQIQNTYTLALSLATSSTTLQPTSLRPKAYIRLTFPFYEMKSSPHLESSDLKPDGARGRWWHETLRGLGKLQERGLNLGVIRCGAGYGPGWWDGEVMARLVVGHIYQYLDEEMKFLYNSDLRIHTVHTQDISASLFLLATYLLSTPRSKVMSECATDIHSPFASSSSSSNGLSLGLGSSSKRASGSDAWKSTKSVIPEKEKISIPLFNIVDEGDSTQGSLAKAVAEVWGVQWGFLNGTMAALIQQFAKSDFTDMVEDVNEKHVEAWSAMLSKSNPPINSTPITPFMDAHAFKKHAICFDGSKARRILGFKPSIPRVEVKELQRIVKGFQEDGIWPKLD